MDKSNEKQPGNIQKSSMFTTPPRLKASEYAAVQHAKELRKKNNDLYDGMQLMFSTLNISSSQSSKQQLSTLSPTSLLLQQKDKEARQKNRFDNLLKELDELAEKFSVENRFGRVPEKKQKRFTPRFFAAQKSLDFDRDNEPDNEANNNHDNNHDHGLFNMANYRPL